MTPDLARREPATPTPFSSFGRLFDEYFGRGGWHAEDGNDRLLAPALDITEDEHAFAVTAELPGLKKEDVQIQFEDGVLAISGEKRHETETKDKSWHRMERRYGEFRRVFRLPLAVEEEKVTAEYKEGILRVTVPKVAEAKPKRVEVKA